MAANFAQSSQCKNWIVPKSQLEKYANIKDRAYLDPMQLKRIKIYHMRVMQMLGERTCTPQRVISTASVLYHRFYSNFVEYDPWLLIPTSLFLAGKVEECTLHQGQGRILIAGMQTIDKAYRYTADDMVACELQLLHHIDYQLIVFHPHRQLIQFIEDSGVLEGCLETAWSLANDSYQTDLCMRFPPFLIALGCICLAGIVLNKEAQLRSWFASLNIEMKYIGEVAKELMDLYEVWKEWNADEIERVSAIIAAKVSDRAAGRDGPTGDS